MARGVNKVILVGNIGQEPEVRYSQAGSAIVNISLATSESWTDKQSGQKQEKTEWHKVVFFNKLAEIAAEYLRKGSQVYIEGSLRTRKWQDQQGQDRYSTEVVASEMQMLGGRQDGQQQQARPPKQPAQAPQQRSQNNHAAPSNYANVPHAQAGYQHAPQQNYQNQSPPNRSYPAPAEPDFDDD